jgi:hypothetical protein
MVALTPSAIAQPVLDADRTAFLALSAFLTGRDTLDGGLASRLVSALVDDDPLFPAAVRALLAFIDTHSVDAMRLQRTLDTERSPLAPLPPKIVTAWYLGIVGQGYRARSIAYETALSAQAVRDVLHAPSYCYGVYGDWARKPV